MRMPMAVSLIVAGLVLSFAVTVSPSWLSIGLLGTTLVVSGLTGLLIAGLGRASRAGRERWHAAGPWLMLAGGTLWLAIHPPYVKGVDLVSLGFIIAVTGAVISAVAAYLVCPWRGRGLLRSWLAPGPAPAGGDTLTDTRWDAGRSPGAGTSGSAGAAGPGRWSADDDPTILLPPIRDDRLP